MFEFFVSEIKGIEIMFIKKKGCEFIESRGLLDNGTMRHQKKFHIPTYLSI